jgi:glycosyltransferase EpsD
MIKVLYIATSDIHLATFHRPYIAWLSGKGCQVDIAVENRGNNTFADVTNTYDLVFPRKLFSGSLIKSFKELKQIIDKGNYDLVHCHTPIPSMIARLAARKARIKGTKVLYTAHGFHFYKGAPLGRWLIYYTAEYLLSKFTDGIVTINKEDYSCINGKMLQKDSWYIPGIGVNPERFIHISHSEQIAIRNEFGFLDTDFIILYIAEFIPRKNHKFIVQAIKKAHKELPNIKVLFAGKGILFENIKELVNNLDLYHTIKFLGFRNDVEKLCAIADLGISASKHEGLGLGLVEQMMCKVPVLATVDRGHKELILNDYNGYLFDQNNSEKFIEFLIMFCNDKKKRLMMGQNAYTKAQDFEIAKSMEVMREIYKHYLPLN